MGDKHDYYKLLVNWKSPKNFANYAVGTLQLKSDHYEFYYNEKIYKQAAEKGFQPFVGLSDVERIYRSPKLFSSFERRIPNTARNDFKRFLKEYQITSDNVEWEYLCITKGSLATDSISFVTPMIYDFKEDVALLNVDVAGWLWTQPKVEDYELEEAISVRVDTNNPKDPEAIEIVLDERDALRLGYIPKPFNLFFYRMQRLGLVIHAKIMAKSPKENRPVVFLACKMNRELFKQQQDLHYMLDIQSFDSDSKKLRSI